MLILQNKFHPVLGMVVHHYQRKTTSIVGDERWVQGRLHELRGDCGPNFKDDYTNVILYMVWEEP